MLSRESDYESRGQIERSDQHDAEADGCGLVQHAEHLLLRERVEAVYHPVVQPRRRGGLDDVWIRGAGLVSESVATQETEKGSVLHSERFV